MNVLMWMLLAAMVIVVVVLVFPLTGV